MKFLKEETTRFSNKIGGLSLWHKLDHILMPNRIQGRALFLGWSQELVNTISSKKTVRLTESVRMVHPILEIAHTKFNFTEASNYTLKLKNIKATYKDGSFYVPQSSDTEVSIDQWAKQQEDKLKWYQYDLCNLVYTYRRGRIHQLLLWELLPICLIICSIINFVVNYQAW